MKKVIIATTDTTSLCAIVFKRGIKINYVMPLVKLVAIECTDEQLKEITELEIVISVEYDGKKVLIKQKKDDAKRKTRKSGADNP